MPERISGNTHRGVIETSVPPGIHLIASGPEVFCRRALNKWLADNVLGEFDLPMIVKVVDEGDEF
jgi:hypothetical protein